MITDNNLAEKEVFSNLQTSHKFGISKAGQSFIIDALSNTIYKNPIGTIVREYVSNAHDANVEAGSKQPVIVSLDNDSNGDYFSVVDMGVGLSEERITSVFVNYGESTKRNNNNEIGGFGIGAKSAFSYSDTFFVNTVVNGFVYKYILMKTNSEPEMQLISKIENTENLPVGSEIRIYIKPQDKYRFREEIYNQLRYFDEVFIKDDENFNEYKIKEFNTFKHSTQMLKSSKFSELHICLGKVAYPIDFRLLGTSSINAPFALKFNIGDLKVTLSREELQYDEITKTRIKEKIAEFREEVKGLYESQKFSFTNLTEFQKQRKNNPSLYFDTINYNIDISSVITYTLKKPMYFKQFPWLNSNTFPSNCNFFLKSKEEISAAGNFIEKRYESNIEDGFDLTKAVYFPKGSVKDRLVNSYLYSIGVIYLITDENIRYNNYKRTLHLPSTYKGITNNMNNVKRIKLFKSFVLKELLKEVKTYSEIIVPQSFKDHLELERKIKAEEAKRLRLLRPKVQVNGVEVYDLTRRAGKGFVKINKDFAKRNYTLILGKKEDAQEMSDFLNKYQDFNKKYGYYCLTNNKGYDDLIKLNNTIPFEGFKEKFKLDSKIKKAYLKYYLSSKDEISEVSNALLCLDKKRDSIWQYEGNITNRQIDFIRNNLSLKIENLISEEFYFLMKKAKRVIKMIPYNRGFLTQFSIYQPEKIFDIKIEVGSDIKNVRKFLTKHGYFPGKNAYCPIDKWEFEFLQQNETKLNYIKSLNK